MFQLIKKATLFIILSFAWQLKAQNNYYFISFKDKDTTNFSQLLPENYLSKKAIERRKKYNLPLLTISEIPVNSKYIDLVSPFIDNHISTIKWLNGILVLASPNLPDSLKKFKHIKAITLVGFDNSKERKSAINLADRISLLEQKFETTETVDSNLFYGKATEQVYFNQIQKLHQLNLKGQNIDIAVFDAGFTNLDKIVGFNKQNIKAGYNIVDEEASIYSSDNDEHGINVVSFMAANWPYNFVGTAPSANYYLFKTENTNSEFPIEEYYWTKAAEIADSLGVDLITSSLGYTEFDNKQFNYKAKDLNGKKTIIAQAVNMAASKGIFVVISAGNEGNKMWETLSTPADADSAFTVTSCTFDSKISNFSSIGFLRKNKVKPNITSVGEAVNYINEEGKIISGNGTSYATPLMAGGIACLMQAFPNKTPFDIKHAIETSADRYYNPDKFWGYGIPNLKLAYKILTTNTITDTIIEYKQLLDSNIHICMNMSSNQKIEITLQSVDEKVVFKQKEKLNFGINRFALNKSHKLKRGLYILKIKTANTVLVKRIEKE